MKMKSLAMLTISGLVAISFGSIAPVMADDMNGGQSMQAPMAPSDNSMMQNQNSNDQNTGSMQGGDNSNSPSNSNGSDEGNSPDTATGDDDY